jgi:hypothetical protein
VRGGLGDNVAKALAAVGITPERVEAWTGKPCGCRERARKLNALGAWARRVLSGKTDEAGEHLEKLMKEE